MNKTEIVVEFLNTMHLGKLSKALVDESVGRGGKWPLVDPEKDIMTVVCTDIDNGREHFVSGANELMLVDNGDGSREAVLINVQRHADNEIFIAEKANPSRVSSFFDRVLNWDMLPLDMQVPLRVQRKRVLNWLVHGGYDVKDFPPLSTSVNLMSSADLYGNRWRAVFDDMTVE